MGGKFQIVVFMAMLFLFLINACKKNEPPSIITDVTRNIGSTGATCGGRITDEGTSSVTARGVCWSTGLNPTISDSKTNDGSGAGTFNSQLSGLTPATTYYVRAYATNGSSTGYGTVISFETIGSPPLAFTLPPLAVNTNEATLKCRVNPNQVFTDVSFEYGETTGYGNSISYAKNPVTYDHPLDVKISNLKAGTIYHYRVKAVNSLGTDYGDDLTFTTTVPVLDIEGNSYNTVTIGPQTWTSQNLEVCRFNNGTDIPLVSEDTTWAELVTAGFCWYNNDELLSKGIYGALYNWHAVNSGGICPIGWHVPTYDEWFALLSYLSENAFYFGGAFGRNLATDTSWTYCSINGSIGNTDSPYYRNLTGFSALGGGIRDAHQRLFGSRGIHSVFWTTSEYDSGKAFAIWLSYDQVGTSLSWENKAHGFSIRCVKD